MKTYIILTIACCLMIVMMVESYTSEKRNLQKRIYLDSVRMDSFRTTHVETKPKNYLYLKSTIRSMERQENLSKQDLLFVLNNMVLEIERLDKTKQEKK